MRTVLARGKKIEVVLSDGDRQEIQRVLDDANAAPFIKTRATILLRSAAGERAGVIAKDVGVDRRLVSWVRHEFAEHGIGHLLTNRVGQHVDDDSVRQITPEIANQAGELHEQGVTFRELAKKFNFSPEGIRQAIERQAKNEEGRSR